MLLLFLLLLLLLFLSLSLSLSLSPSRSVATAADAPEVADRGLHGGAGGGTDAVHVLALDAARAEEAAVSKVLCPEVSDRELGEDDLGAGLDASVELVVDDLPLGVDDALVLGRVLDADLGVLLLRLWKGRGVGGGRGGGEER